MKLCPECQSNHILVYEETCWVLNTMEHYCHAIKAHDADAKVECQECEWSGELRDLQERVTSSQLITTIQAEAYAAAQVRQALEGAAEIADLNNDFTTCDAIRALMSQGGE